MIDSVISNLPEKYNTLIGERGLKLSGGQRQRIAIARALYKGAELIIFDEATSALDRKTEMQVLDSLNHLGNNLTIIIVTHKVETLQNCDQIIDLTSGKIKIVTN
jgi:ATP-binding cassette subfamily B protein